MPVEVCPICDIAGCHHIRERREVQMDENARLRAAAQFLVDRIEEFEPDDTDAARMTTDFYGHIVPAHEQLMQVLAALTPATEAPKGGEGGMPERIWADPPETFDGMDMWRSDPGGKGVEYIRADLVATPAPGADFKAGMLRAADELWTARDEIHKASPGPDRAERRSRFFPGLASAMADQWGGWAMERVAA